MAVFKHIPKSNSSPLKITCNFLTKHHIITVIILLGAGFIYVCIFWYNTCSSQLSNFEAVHTWTSTPPDLEVTVKAIDVCLCFCFFGFFCFCFLTEVICALFISSWLMSSFVLGVRSRNQCQLSIKHKLIWYFQDLLCLSRLRFKHFPSK